MGCEHQLNMTNLENVWKPPAGENDQKDKKWGKQGRFLCRRVQSLSPPSDWPFCFWLTIVLCNKLYPAYIWSFCILYSKEIFILIIKKYFFLSKEIMFGFVISFPIVQPIYNQMSFSFDELYGDKAHKSWVYPNEDIWLYFLSPNNANMSSNFEKYFF